VESCIQCQGKYLQRSNLVSHKPIVCGSEGAWRGQQEYPDVAQARQAWKAAQPTSKSAAWHFLNERSVNTARPYPEAPRLATQLAAAPLRIEANGLFA